MTTQLKAQRLADALMDYYKCSDQDIDEAAAELRRLSAVEAQRDALLEALRYIDAEFRKHGRQHWPEAVRARAAIKAVEETK